MYYLTEPGHFNWIWGIEIEQKITISRLSVVTLSKKICLLLRDTETSSQDYETNHMIEYFIYLERPWTIATFELFRTPSNKT